MNMSPYIPGILESFLKQYGEILLQMDKTKDVEATILEFYHNDKIFECKSKTVKSISIDKKIYKELLLKLPLFIEENTTSVHILMEFFTKFFNSINLDTSIGFTFYNGMYISILDKNTLFSVRILFEEKYDRKKFFSLII
jgi:hypothetical protein